MKTRKGSFREALIGNKVQRKKNRILLWEILLILGAIFFGQAILAMFPLDMDAARVLGGFGFLLIITAIIELQKDKK